MKWSKLTSGSILIVVAVSALLLSMSAPAEEHPMNLDEYRNITAPPDPADFVPYDIKSVPEDTDPSLGELININAEVVDGPNELRTVSVRALKPRAGISCNELGMGDYQIFIDDVPTWFCVVVEVKQ